MPVAHKGTNSNVAADRVVIFLFSLYICIFVMIVDCSDW